MTSYQIKTIGHCFLNTLRSTLVAIFCSIAPPPPPPPPTHRDMFGISTILLLDLSTDYFRTTRLDLEQNRLPNFSVTLSCCCRLIGRTFWVPTSELHNTPMRQYTTGGQSGICPNIQLAYGRLSTLAILLHSLTAASALQTLTLSA